MVTKQKGRLEYGYVIVHHKGTPIPTSVGSKRYEGRFSGEQSLVNFGGESGNIPIGYAHRPDLMGNLYLGSAMAWWLICERNAIFDIFEQLNSGDAIRLPNSL